MTMHSYPFKAADLAGAADWYKSSYSDNGTNCVEVADLTATAHAGVAIRDSKDPQGAALLVAPQQFTAFLAHVTK